MRINNNLNAMNAHRNMSSITGQQGKAMEKLSSGSRINRAGDDAAGLAISENMRSQIRGLTQASRNAQDGISMIQTAEGAISETQNISQRMRELAVQSSNGTYTDEDRSLINQEFEQLGEEINRIANDTEFNGMKVLDGSLQQDVTVTAGTAPTLAGLTSNGSNDFSQLGGGDFKVKINAAGADSTIEIVDAAGSVLGTSSKFDITTGESDLSINIDGNDFKFDVAANSASGESTAISNTEVVNGEGINLQVGANQNQQISFSIEKMDLETLGLKDVSVDTAENAENAITSLDSAVASISKQRADLGAVQNRLESTVASTDNTAENLQAAESRIRDVDMAKEMMNLTKLNVLQQASQAMFSQANQAPQQVMSILR